jgi:leucyl aminopeptidase
MKIIYEATKDFSKGSGVLGVGCFEGEKNSFEKDSKKFSGKSEEVFLVPSKNPGHRHVFLLGLGKKEKFSLEKVRLASARLLCRVRGLKEKEAALDLDSITGKFSTEKIAGAVVEGARLSSYRFKKYKSKQRASFDIERYRLLGKSAGKSRPVAETIRQSELLSDGVFFTRDLANEPPNVMTPSRLAESARKMAATNNLTCRILNKKEMGRLKMGGILGVSQGSAEEPKFIILENRPSRTKFSQPLVLVGKGITFDTGGISIKPSNDMDKMKFDMCGAAAVIGAMKVIANLKLPVKVVGLAPVCENMPGGRAQRPGDIVTCLNGKTVEVLNTDAEGRLILADALSYAAKYKPKALVDIATLTGACAATFSDVVSGLMGTDPELVNRLKEAGERSGDRLWELPLYEEYSDMIRATYADIQNISKKSAGAITAGMFLKEFADHTKSWAHLDIAGTAWNEKGPKLLSPIGATGVGVRLFVEFVKSYL